MYEIISHIFGSLNSSERNIKYIQKTLRKQAKINEYTRGFMFLMGMYIFWAEYCSHKRDKKIKQMSKEIEELKQQEGD